MIRLSANLSRKMPLPGIPFSSQQYGAALEIEVSDADKPEAIQSRIKELYDLLNRSIDEQIAAATKSNTPASESANSGTNGPDHEQAPDRRTNGRTSSPRTSFRRNGNGNGNGHGNGSGNGERRATGATQAQQRAIYAICKNLGIEQRDALADYNVSTAADLTVLDASRLIDALKAREARR